MDAIAGSEVGKLQLHYQQRVDFGRIEPRPGKLEARADARRFCEPVPRSVAIAD